MQTMIVTGGAGFIGGNFVLKTIAAGDYRVINLDALTYAGNLDTLGGIIKHPNHCFVHGNIGNRLLVEQLFRDHKPQIVVNFAAESHVDRSIDSPLAFIETNVAGTFTLLEAARNYWANLSASERRDFRFLHISTDEVYGSLGATGKFTETTAYAPNSPYSASKAASDHLLRAYFHTYGLPTLTTNCSNNYGPYQFPEKLIPLIIQKALAWQPIPVYGDGANIRDWLYVEDHCRAIADVLEQGVPGEVYNIGGNSEKTNLEIVHTVCALLDTLVTTRQQPHNSLITFVKDRPGHDRRYAIDASKIKQSIGWEPKESFTSGIEKTVRWYLENQKWCQRVLDGSYRGERLGGN